MRNFVLLAGAIVLSTFCCDVFGQNKTLGVGVLTPNPNAALHVESPTGNQGFIMPRLTSVQRNAMSAVLTDADKGLMLFDTSLNTIFIWDGLTWKSSSQVAGGPKLVYPYKDSVTTSPGAGADLFKLIYTGTAAESAGVAHFENQNGKNTKEVVSVVNNGMGSAGRFTINNRGSKMPALWAETNSDSALSAPLYGLNTGTGDAAGAFRITNAANTFSAAFAETNGSGPALFANQIGAGRAGQFQIQNANNAEAAVRSFTNGTGRAGFFTINNAANASAGIFSTTNGSGPALQAENSGAADGFAGLFSVTNPTNTFPAVQASSSGSGSGIRVMQNTGTGAGVDVFMQNASSTAPGVSVDQGGTGAAINARHTGTSGDAVYAEKVTGTGSAGNFRVSDVNNTASAVYGATTSAGGVAIGAANEANGIALAIWNGGVQVTTSVVSTATSISSRASAYQVTFAATTFSLDFGPKDGEVFMIFNDTAQTITINNASGTPVTTLLSGEGKTFIVFPGGAIRAF